ncbi:MAG: DUF2855 family protein [Caulobacteraceae bacterium]|nr:DUF2855 family protein [Caulobacteraceae bacterium]
MTELTQIEVQRDDLTKTRLVRRPLPDLAAGQVLARVDTFALTANNVTYGVSGDMLGYWHAYPAQLPWGIIPVWGFATVTASRHDEIEVGERIWGFLPMASHVVLEPGEVSRRGFKDAAAHREPLADVYNRLQRTREDPPELAGLDAERSALVPLFTTSFIVDDFLADNAWFGARQLVILSASSKTGWGLASFAHHREGHPVHVVGVTSAANTGFVQGLGVCDQVIAYGEIETLDASIPTVLVDMAGSAEARSRTHHHFGANLTYSCVVGATHWTERGPRGDLPGATPTFFFAPGQIAKRDAELGSGVIRQRAQAEALRIARETAHLRTTEQVTGPDACLGAFAEMVAGRVAPERLLMLSLSATAA